MHFLYLNPLAGKTAAGDGGAAAEGLELGVHDVTVVVNLYFFFIKKTRHTYYLEVQTYYMSY